MYISGFNKGEKLSHILVLARSRRILLWIAATGAVSLTLGGCGSKSADAQITVTAPAVTRTSTLAPVTETPDAVTMTATAVVDHTVPPLTRVKVVTTTIVKTAPPVTVNHTTTAIKTPAPMMVTVTAQPPEAAGAFGEGTQLVGTDIKAGTYRSAGGSSCYWERLSGASGDTDDIIANDVATTHPVVEIASSDFAFTSHDCGEWTKIG